jgi:hypothetical protein
MARGQRTSRAKFLAALAKVPDVEPEDYDKLKESTANKRLHSGRGQRTNRKKRRSRASGCHGG